MSDLLDEAHEFLLCMDKMEYADTLFALRAELTEARRQLAAQPAVPEAVAVDDETKEFFLSHRFDQLGRYPNDRALILLTEAGFNFVRAAILSATDSEGRKDE